MDLEVEIPIWYSGKMKWISNLSSRSTCSDVIRAILLSSDVDDVSSWESFDLYECWRGVERPLKSRCRLLKLWHSWAGETSNVTLTLRREESVSQCHATHFLLSQQEKKLRKVRRQLDRLEKEESIWTLSRSIVDLQRRIDNEDKSIRRLSKEISDQFRREDFTSLLCDVNQTLIISRQFSEQSDQLEEQIQRINEDIETKQALLDELELDHALEHNIEIDSLDDDDEEEDECSPVLPVKSSFSLSVDSVRRDVLCSSLQSSNGDRRTSSLL